MDEEPRHMNSVEHLRYLIEQHPGEHLVLEIASNITFENARKMWEAATLEGGHTVSNREMLRAKMEASDFINEKIGQLKIFGDKLNGHIGCMRSWINQMVRNLRPTHT